MIYVSSLFINIVLVLLTSLGSAQEIPDDFQEDLYRKYFMENLLERGAWEDFCCQKSGVVQTKRKEEVIISLTTYPGRMPTTWLAIESLLRQDDKPDRIVLNLFEGEFPDRKLPLMIQKQQDRGLEINWWPENLKVYLKVIPAMLTYPTANIVAVDDDVIYPPQRLGNLIKGHAKYPDCVIAQDVREIKMTNHSILPVPYWNFTGWHLDNTEKGPSHYFIPEGVFGIFYPPSCLYQDFAKKDLFFQLCPSDDDAWFYTMIVANGKKVVKIPSSRKLVNIESTQEMESALWATNFKDNSLVLRKTFKTLFWAYNLNTILGKQDVLMDLHPEKFFRYANNDLKFKEKVEINNKNLEAFLNSPIDLKEGFSSLEAGGIWTVRDQCKVGVYTPPSQAYQVVFNVQPYVNDKNPFIGVEISSVGGRIVYKKNMNKAGTICYCDTSYKGFEEYVIKITNSKSPAELFGHNDQRRLGLYFKSAQVSPLQALPPSFPLNLSMDPNLPLNFVSGFYDKELPGVWMGQEAELAFILPQINEEYAIYLAGKPYITPSNPFVNLNIAVDGKESFQYSFNYPVTTPGVTFRYTPRSSYISLKLKVEGASLSKGLGFNQNDRILGYYLQGIKWEKTSRVW